LPERIVKAPVSTGHFSSSSILRITQRSDERYSTHDVPQQLQQKKRKKYSLDTAE
jgi:hypothetical protein